MKNIGGMLKQRAVVSPHLEAYVEPSTNVRMSYAQFNAMANQCADVLTSLGFGPGDRVALLMPNSVEFCCLFYGAAKIGAVAVPLNTRLTAPELAFILSDSGSKAIGPASVKRSNAWLACGSAGLTLAISAVCP